MEILPLLTVRKRYVAAPQGPSHPEPALDALARLPGTGLVYLWDADGVERNRPDYAFLQSASRRRSLWADLGSRFATDAADALVGGADRVTIRWSRLADEAELSEFVELSDSAWLGIEFSGAEPLANPRRAGDRLETILGLARDLRMGIVGVDLDGSMAVGLNKIAAAQLQRFPGPKFFVGGLRSAADTSELDHMGFSGAIVSNPELVPEAA